MPSVLGHALFATALGASAHARGAVIAAGALCAVAPDLDVLAFRFGVPYESPFGHRGFTHSLSFALALGAVVALALRALLRADARPRFAPTFALLALATASHGVLDALTDGGLGVAFFWPLEDARHFFAWRPIPVSPLSAAHFFGARGAAVVANELTWIGAPCLMLVAASRFLARIRG